MQKRSISAALLYSLGKIVLALCVVNLSALSAATLALGERVQTIGQTAVFQSAPYAGRFAEIKSPNESGSIIDGPVRAGEISWWKIRFDGGAEGWVADRQLAGASGS